MSFQLLPVLGCESCFEKRGVEHLGAAGLGLSEELWTVGALSRQSHLLGGRRAWKCKAPPISVLLSGTVTEASSLRGYKSPAEGLSIIWSSEAIREKGHKSKFIKGKMFCTAKPTMSEDKRKMTNKRKLYATCMTDRGLVSLTYKEVLQISTKKADNQ